MVKHVILWQLKDELSAEEKAEVKKGIKEGLEGLAGKIPGLLDIQVQIEEFLKFADYFFDGLFADWTVMDEIDESISEVKHTKSEILAVIGKLELKLENVESGLQKLLEEREKLVISEK